ncbi:hypothetical protein EJ03DRAFT_84368 [Teratosphaeria nubilosa]|uniref:Uncharacterized protein n=1 Tax=Teratosphaeria nubilosa TaxID=161662 RepID=A0A6G1LB08_9PEZI|nr:hypothetical protein EJ03DRAFT_84368 [Teratosphaeria nubilosa]
MKLALVAIIFLWTSVRAQQQCYFGPGAKNRGPANLVPCNSNGQSACCLLGDTCLSGNTCYNYATGDLYQYGCTDINYKDATCPYKCGFNSTRSPWTALEYCNNVANVTDTWVCHAPESCGCQWNSSTDLLVLAPRGCKEMGSDARVALYAPSVLAPYVSLPSTYGGNTSYYSPVTIAGTKTWIETALPGYTPATVTQLTKYEDGPSSVVQIIPNLKPAASTVSAPVSPSAIPSVTSTPPFTASSTTTPTSSTPPSVVTKPSSQGLSQGAKAGIGVGVAGGFLLLASVAFAAYLYGNRQRKRNAEASQQQPQPPGIAPDGSTTYSPSMQQSSPYQPSTADKTPSWQPGWPQPYPPPPQFGPQQPYPYSFPAQPPYLSLSAPLLDEAPYKENVVAPQPMELEAHETEGAVEVSGSPRAESAEGELAHPRTDGAEEGPSPPRTDGAEGGPSPPRTDGAEGGPSPPRT